MTPEWLQVIDRPFPSSTLVVVPGPRALVVDPGAVGDADLLPGLLSGAGVRSADVATVVCTHYHADHVGAVASLQADGASVAAHAWEGAVVNARDRSACASRWLVQPVAPFEVDILLRDGDRIDTGEVELTVIHTPGRTLGGVSLWEPGSRTLICGDALHADDVPWIGMPHEGATSLQLVRSTLDVIEALEPSFVISGHGPLIEEPAAAIAMTRERLNAWEESPLEMVLHASKRTLTYRLMLEPIPSDDAEHIVAESPWLRELASSVGWSPAEFTELLLERLARSLLRTDGRLRTKAPHRASPEPVPWHLTDPRRWAAPLSGSRRAAG